MRIGLFIPCYILSLAERLWPPPAKPSSQASSRCVPAPPAPAARIWSPASMKPAATMRPFWLSPVTCPARCRGLISSRRHSQIFFSATSPSIRKQSLLQSRRQASFTRQSQQPMRAGARSFDASAGCHRGQGGRRVLQCGNPEAPSGVAASGEDIAEITRWIDQPDSVVIMCGGGCRGAADQLRALSDRLKAPLIHSVKGKDIMPYDDPRWMGGIGMIGTKAVYNAIIGCDLLLMVGTDYPYSNFLPSKGTVIQIDERPQVLGRRAPTVLGVTGSARPTLKLLLDEVASKTNTHFWDKVTRERQKWDEMLDEQADLARSKDRIHPQAVARAVSDLAKPDAIFVSTPVSTRFGPATGSGKVERSELLVPSTTGPWGQGLVRPTGYKHWIARAR